MDENPKKRRKLDPGSQRDVERQDNEGQTSQALDHQIQRSVPQQCTGTTIQGSNIVNSNVIMNSGPVTITNQSIVENVNIDELCKDLQNSLVEAAKNASETIDPVVDLDHIIDWVSLEIAESNEPSITNETTHHHRREDFQKMYKTFEGNLSLKQLWPLAQQEAKNEAETKCKTESAKQDNIRKHGNVVGILGEAGIGKTTLCKILVQEVLKEKSQMYDCQCQYIFYIPVRNMDFKTETFFLPLLLSSASCEYSSLIKEEQIRDKVLDKLDKNPNVVIILDGLDEADINLDSQPSNISKYAKSTAEYFIKNILQGKLLPNAKKYVTSRPRQFYDLHNDCRPRFKANILGLSKESQRKLCREICGESYSDVLTYLQNHPDIFAYCYVPVNCQLVCFCIHQFLRNGNDQLSHCTMSKIMTSAFSLFLDSSHFRENLNSEEMQKELKKIPALAWYGFVNKMLLFKKGDLKKNGIDNNKALDCFLHSFVAGKRSNLRFKVIEGKKVFFFSHMIWQEFLSAMHLILFMPLEDFQQHLHEFGSSWWQMVTKFMFGILCQDVCEQLEEIFPTMFAHNDDEIARKIAYLKNFTSKYLQDSIKRSFDFKSFLQLCTLVYEFQNEDLTSEIAEKMPTMIAVGGDLLPSDITSFHYVLSKRKNSIDLKFHVNSIEDSFQHFFEKMSSIGSILMISAVSCNKGNLDLTNMQSLVKCLNKITCLSLNGCVISGNAAKCLAEGLCKLSAPISELYLARTKIGDTGAQYLSNCLRKIKKLYLAENGITQNGAEFISEGLKPLKQPMTCLELSCNSIGDEGASSVASSLSKVEQLDVRGCGFTEEGVKAFADAVKTTNMKKLELSYQDPLKASHRPITISCDMEILLKKTSYHRDRITGVGVELICEFLKHCKQIENVTFKRLSYGDCAATAIAQLLYNLKHLEHLDLSNSDMTSDDAKVIVRSLQDPSQQQLSFLSLSYTKIGDDGARFISTYLSKFESLDLSNCGITAIGAKYLSDGLRQLKTPMKSLTLGSNLLRDEGASSLASSLSKLEGLFVSYCGFTEKGVETFTDALRKAQINQFGPKQFFLSYENPYQTSVKADPPICFTCDLEDLALKLDYSCSNITGAGVEMICEFVKRCSTFNRFSVTGVRDGDRAAKAIAQCMHKLKHLEIRNCDLTSSGIKALADAIRSLPEHQMLDLDFSLTKVNDDGAKLLSTCLSNIKQLYIPDSGINAEGAKFISNGLLQLKEPMEEIYLWDNDIGDIGAEALARSVHKIKRIGLSGCGITHIGMEHMSRAIEKLSQPIMFQVAENKIGFKGAKSLSTCVENINFLNVFRCQLTEEGVRILRKAVDESPGVSWQKCFSLF
ncbi:unnamed protein product [Clavelina lepadiformis]|uniref:NACHT domain-containing protein n=1 Tax=Clavelina lepadiformis TaxID=159417 RepID=A0ABP0G9S5_CLALP